MVGILSRQYGSTWKPLHEFWHGSGTEGLLSVPNAFRFYKTVFGMQEKTISTIVSLSKIFSNDATGHIAFPKVSYILPPVPSMSLITLFPWWFLSSSDVIFWTYWYLSASREIASLCWTAPFPTCLVFLSNNWKQLLAVSKPESEIMSNLLSFSFKNLLKLWRILSS